MTTQSDKAEPGPSLVYIGLGQMGAALARRLASAERIAVHDRVAECMRPFAEQGAIALPKLEDLPGSCRVVVTCLPRNEMVEELLFQDGGPASTLREGSVVVDMTTGHPDVARRIAAGLARRRIGFVDAPVSGGPQAADAGTIAIMMGGATDHVETIRPILLNISPNLIHMGEVGAGCVMKLVNNMIAAGNRLVAFEGIAIAVDQGLDPRLCVDVLNRSSGRNYSTETNFSRHIFTDQLEQKFKLGLSLKDVSLAVELVPGALRGLAVSPRLAGVLSNAADSIGGEQDINRIIRLYEKAIGAPIAHRTEDN